MDSLNYRSKWTISFTEYRMSQMNEMLDAGTNHYFFILNQKGKPILRIPLWIAILLIIAAPQLVVVILVAMALEIISVKYEG